VHVIPVVSEVHVRAELDATKFTRDFVDRTKTEMLHVAFFTVEQSLAVGALHDGVEALLCVQVPVEILHVLIAVQTQVHVVSIFVYFDKTPIAFCRLWYF
jgi:hypothetical protein